MILHARINIADRMQVDDGKAFLYELRLSDISKPVQFRTAGEFICYLSEDKIRGLSRACPLILSPYSFEGHGMRTLLVSLEALDRMMFRPQSPARRPVAPSAWPYHP